MRTKCVFSIQHIENWNDQIFSSKYCQHQLRTRLNPHDTRKNSRHGTHGSVHQARQRGRRARLSPYPGDLGKRLWENVSKEAWAAWLKQQTMLVNENRLNLADLPAPASTWRARWKSTSSAKAPTRRSRATYLRPPPLIRRHLSKTPCFCPSALSGWTTAQPAAALQPALRRPLPQRTQRAGPGPRGLPQWLRPARGAWGGQPQWTMLETGFGLGLNFLVTWAAWKADPDRPRLLHFVSTEAFPASAADVLRSARTHPELVPSRRTAAGPALGPAAGLSPPGV